MFPVDMFYYHKVEGRVKLARTIDKEEHKLVASNHDYHNFCYLLHSSGHVNQRGTMIGSVHQLKQWTSFWMIPCILQLLAIC